MVTLFHFVTVQLIIGFERCGRSPPPPPPPQLTLCL
jgi:hypothetical protein